MIYVDITSGFMRTIEIRESALSPVYPNTFSSKTISFSMKTQPIVLCLRIAFISFSAVCTKTMKTIENCKNSGNLLFACQNNLNNLWLLLHRFQKFAFSMKTIRLHDNHIIVNVFSCVSKISLKISFHGQIRAIVFFVYPTRDYEGITYIWSA